MNRHLTRQGGPRVQALLQHAFSTLAHCFRIDAVSGGVLLIAAATAFAWANSPAADSYHALWHTPLSLGVGSHVFSGSVHFAVNDAIMTIFFLVVGMEIRREIHEGALATVRQAALPFAAAIGGVAVPALIYMAFNHHADQRQGWAVPTATDIAFAVGVLALLGRSVPGNVRILLLAIAIIDDIVAILIIAAFYSAQLNYSGLVTASIGILMVVGMQRIGVASAWSYVLPGAIVWLGFLQTGVHPTLAGVVLGMMTPAAAYRSGHQQQGSGQLAPVVKVHSALHPWVAYCVMPLFAMANAGVTLADVDLSLQGAQSVVIGVIVALMVGKPAGIILASWLAVRLRLCRLPAGVTWSGVCLAGLLAGIGFTMSIFIATLAFSEANLLNAAKVGVLIASLAAGVIGLAWGRFCAWDTRVSPSPGHDRESTLKLPNA